jgi:hypothetical protein
MHSVTPCLTQRCQNSCFPGPIAQGVEARLTYDYAVTPHAVALQALTLPQARAAQGEPFKSARPLPNWHASDSLDYRAFEHAMHEGLPIEYAFCQWLMQHEESDGFTVEHWETWYQYARTHGPRFDKEQPQARRREQTLCW